MKKTSVITLSATLLAALLTLQSETARATDGYWTNKVGGVGAATTINSWGVSANWTNGVPGASAGDRAFINVANITNAEAITLDGDRTLGALYISDSATTFKTFTILQGTSGSLIFDNAGAGASLTMPVAANTTQQLLGCPVKLNDNLLITNLSTTTSTAIFAFTNVIADGANAYSITYNGPSGLIQFGAGGTLNINNTYHGGTIVNAGQIKGGANGCFGYGSVTVNSGGEAAFIATGAVPHTWTNAFNLGGTGWASEPSGPVGALRFSIAGDTLAGPVTLTSNSRMGSVQAAASYGILSGSLAGNYELELGNYNANLTAVAFTFTNKVTANTLGSLRLSAPYASTDPLIMVCASTSALSPGPVIINGGILKLNGYSYAIANLSDSGSGGQVLNGSVTTASTLTVGADNTSTTFGGVLGNGDAATLGLTKVGTGTFTLTGANTNTGTTTVNSGSLGLTGSGSLASASIIVGAGGIFDVSGLSSQPFVLTSSQTLGNNSSTATVNGSVDASSGKVLLSYAPGTPSFTVTNGTLTLASGTALSINNTGAALANGSYLIISTNTGGAVTGTVPASVSVGGNGLGSGGSAALSLASSELYLNVTGVITVATNSPMLTNSLSGHTLSLSWPNDHLGWHLEVQTNSLTTGLGKAWHAWPGSAGVTSTNIYCDPANPAVFFRLVYP